MVLKFNMDSFKNRNSNIQRKELPYDFTRNPAFLVFNDRFLACIYVYIGGECFPQKNCPMVVLVVMIFLAKNCIWS